MSTTNSFTDRLKEKVIVFDGAMGTSIQSQQLTADDFHGEQFNGCNEFLVITKPRAVEAVHAGFLAAGCDVVETDTFGGTPTVLAEYGLADRAYELNVEAAKIARRIASQFSRPSEPRFVAGSMGPTTKLPSLGHISFADMESAYAIQARGLIDGGADLLVVETCQDLLQTKAALAGIFSVFASSGRRLPVIASITIETTGAMLLGTEISAALTALEPFEIDLIGMNCATGPKEMSENVRYLAAASPKPVFVMPNAGIPENVGGHAHYSLSPEEFVYYLAHYVRDLGVSVVGGCCGTTPDHLRALAAAVGSLSPRRREWTFTPGASCLYQSAPFHIDPPPVLIGERSNANGSKQFRELLLREDWEGIVAMGKAQAREGAHLLDVCVAYVGRDEASDMREVVTRYNTQVSLPLMIDSTEAPVIEDALRRIAGKAIVNSVNLEDGEERVARILPLCRKYGAAVVALTIDEEGMAKTAERKLGIARRIHALATGAYRMPEADLIFDTLTFTLGSGDEEFRRSALETIRAISLIKKEFPAVHTSLGISNVSFGLAPHARAVLNSVFLHFAIEHGLDMAIVHASRIMPLYKIAPAEQEICRRLIFDERRAGSDPLQELMAFYAGAKSEPRKKDTGGGPVEERLKSRVVEGDKAGLQDDLDEALKRYQALEIINTILLDGMKTVGELFGSGQMQLPFVLQSAEVMKSAVSYLEQFMDKAASTSKGTLVIATVKGDVHDIGKNLVDIILTNNGYKVVNLGIQCPLDRMLAAAAEHRADAIGMSGLLVKSTLIMKQNLEVMNERGDAPLLPVILGGAALTRRYVEQDLRSVYRGTVRYANDAFDGLRFMEGIVSRRGEEGPGEPETPAAPVEESPDEHLSGLEAKIAMSSAGDGPHLPSVGAADIPTAPFYGVRTVDDVPLDEVFSFVNENALIRGQWQVRRGNLSSSEYAKLIEDKVLPELRSLQARCAREHLLEPRVVYGYFACQSEGDDLIVYDGPPTADGTGRAEQKERVRFTFPRQLKGKRLCIADYFAAKSSGRMDVVAFHLVTMGLCASEHSKKLFESDNYRDYLYFHGLSVESAEALAELWHRRIRRELGIHGQDSPDVRKLFSQHYRGSRYSFGYPACPRLEDQSKLFELLHPQDIGVSLTEEFQLVPEQSTSAIIVHHPEARYFAL